MQVTRRGFLATAGAGVSSTLALLTGSPQKAYGKASGDFKISRTTETTTICPYCAVGCGIIVHSRGGKVVNTEGDPEHPINEGSLCPKGASLYQLANNEKMPNEKRLQKVLYRAAKATEFQEKSWDWAAKEIAKRIKKTRDKTFREKNDKG